METTLANDLHELQRFEMDFRKAIDDSYTTGVSMRDFLILKEINNRHNERKIGSTGCCGSELLKALRVVGSWYFAEKNKVVKVTTEKVDTAPVNAEPVAPYVSRRNQKRK
jgi:hypothetical protein